VPCPATSCSSSRTWASSTLTPRGKSYVLTLLLTIVCAYCIACILILFSVDLYCSGRLITSQGRRDLDQVAGRVVAVVAE
jgi:hypothetical protein